VLDLRLLQLYSLVFLADLLRAQSSVQCAVFSIDHSCFVSSAVAPIADPVKLQESTKPAASSVPAPQPKMADSTNDGTLTADSR